MLLIDGVFAIVAGAAMIALARLVAADGVALSAPLRRAVCSRAFDTVAVLLMCGGGLTLLMFLAVYDKEPALLVQTSVAAAIGVGGTLGIRAMLRRAGPPKAAEPPALTDPADGPMPNADQPKRAA